MLAYVCWDNYGELAWKICEDNHKSGLLPVNAVNVPGQNLHYFLIRAQFDLHKKAKWNTMIEKCIKKSK